MKTILITDTHTQLGFGLLKAFLQEGFSVIAAPSQEQKSGVYDSLKKKPLFVVNWNRTSPISAKNVLLQGLQKIKSLDTALVLETPFPDATPFSELKYLEIDRVIDHWMKGSLFLTRELMTYFFAKNAGVLSFINLSLQKTQDPALLDDLCRESLLTVFDGIVESARQTAVKINAFLSRSDDRKAYIEFIVKNVTEKCYKAHGKLFYFQWK